MSNKTKKISFTLILAFLTTFVLRNFGRGEYSVNEHSFLEELILKNIIWIVFLGLILLWFSYRNAEKIVKMKRNEREELKKIGIKVKYFLIFIVIIIGLYKLEYFKNYNDYIYIPIRGIFIYYFSMFEIFNLNSMIAISILTFLLLSYSVYWILDYKVLTYIVSLNINFIKFYIILKILVLDIATKFKIYDGREKKLFYLYILLLMNVEKRNIKGIKRNGDLIIKEMKKKSLEDIKIYSIMWKNIFFVETIYLIFDIEIDSVLDDEFTKESVSEGGRYFHLLETKKSEIINKYKGKTKKLRYCFILREYKKHLNLKNYEYSRSFISRMILEDSLVFLDLIKKPEDKILLLLIEYLNEEIAKKGKKYEGKNQEEK